MSYKPLMQHLDSPMRILSFSLSDFIGYAAPLIIGGAFDSLFIIPLIGGVLIYLVKKALKKLPKFFLFRYLYWVFPTALYNKMLKIDLPPSAHRLRVK